MVYSATENVKKRLGSCEKVTMKLRSLLNISNISSTCASHKRLEDSSEVKDREFRLVTWDESSQVLMESITSTTISCINSILHYDVDIKSNMLTMPICCHGFNTHYNQQQALQTGRRARQRRLWCGLCRRQKG